MKVYRAKTPARAIQKTIDVAASFGEDLDKRVYIFVESRASLSYEAAIAKKLGGSFSISVMSFSRYVSLSQKVEKYLTKTSAALVIRKLIEENFSILTRLRRGTSNLAVNVYNVISQMKSAKVSPKDLFSVIEKEGGAFAGKLKDIAFLYAEYERFIKDGGYTDENAFLQMMPDILRHDENMRGAKVIVSGISNLTKNAIDILDTLNALTDLSVVTVSHDAAGYTNEIYRKILALYKDCRIFDDGKASDEQEAVINGLFDPLVFKKAGLYSDKVHIFEYADVTGEAHAVAKRIRFEVVNNKRRYRDFVIAAGDVARYAPLYKRVFSEYGIPLFADEKKSIAAHPLVTLILTLIDCKRLNFRPDVCLKAVKNPFFTDEAQAGAFEDYLLAVTPSRRMMVKEFSVPEAEKARSKLVEVVSELSTKNTVNGYIGWLLRLYDRFCFDAGNQKLSDDLSAMGEDELAMFTVTAYKALSGLIESTASVAGDALVDIDLFKSLFSSAVGATEISLIATHSDCVFFGDTRTAPLYTAKVLFCVGFDSGVPSVKK
ncbi:MAG: hypothetical protein ILP02_03050, partial [Clostridia bacterium]|nr:hypothetical protein [Clostridia bacterium]